MKQPVESGRFEILKLAMGKVARDFGADERNRKAVIIAATVILPAVLAVWCGFLPSLFAREPSLGILGTALLVTFQIVAIWLTLDRPATTGPLLLALSESEQALAEERAALEAMRQQAGRLARVQSYALTLHALTAVSADRPISELLDQVVGPLAADVPGFFGLDTRDIWSIAVYLRDPLSGRLRCALRHLDPRHPATGKVPREWKPGEGHVGQCFNKPDGRAGLITQDASAGPSLDLLEGKGPQFRTYDLAFYRSFASFTFGRPGPDHPAIGVLIGTSSQVGAFDEATTLPLRHAAASLSTLADHLDPSRPGFDWPSPGQNA